MCENTTKLCARSAAKNALAVDYQSLQQLTTIPCIPTSNILLILVYNVSIILIDTFRVRNRIFRKHMLTGH